MSRGGRPTDTIPQQPSASLLAQAEILNGRGKLLWDAADVATTAVPVEEWCRGCPASAGTG